jgi:hypothetical protein
VLLQRDDCLVEKQKEIERAHGEIALQRKLIDSGRTRSASCLQRRPFRRSSPIIEV